MPYVTHDDSKPVKRIAEIEQELQEKKREWEQWLATSPTPRNAAEAMECESRVRALTDRMQALATAWELQTALSSPALQEPERKLSKSWSKRMKDFGYRPVIGQFLEKQEIDLMARYWRRSQAASVKREGDGLEDLMEAEGTETMESAIRRVVTLRLKGASIFWTEEHAEQMLLLRTYYKSNRWQVLEHNAFATLLETAA